MNLGAVNWELSAAGSWPLAVKTGVVVVAAVLTVIVGVYYIAAPQLTALAQLEQQQQTLQARLENRQQQAANLTEYRAQVEQLERTLTELTEQLPSKTGIADLLLAISRVGLASGLEFRLFKPMPGTRKDFYTQLPINIEVVGSYAQLGLFVRDLASFSRIVTIHDIVISPTTNLLLTMSATIKTYHQQANDEQTNAPN